MKVRRLFLLCWTNKFWNWLANISNINNDENGRVQSVWQFVDARYTYVYLFSRIGRVLIDDDSARTIIVRRATDGKICEESVDCQDPRRTLPCTGASALSGHRKGESVCFSFLSLLLLLPSLLLAQDHKCSKFVPILLFAGRGKMYAMCIFQCANSMNPNGIDL